MAPETQITAAANEQYVGITQWLYVAATQQSRGQLCRFASVHWHLVGQPWGSLRVQRVYFIEEHQRSSLPDAKCQHKVMTCWVICAPSSPVSRVAEFWSLQVAPLPGKRLAHRFLLLPGSHLTPPHLWAWVGEKGKDFIESFWLEETLKVNPQDPSSPTITQPWH